MIAQQLSRLQRHGGQHHLILTYPKLNIQIIQPPRVSGHPQKTCSTHRLHRFIVTLAQASQAIPAIDSVMLVQVLRQESQEIQRISFRLPIGRRIDLYAYYMSRQELNTSNYSVDSTGLALAYSSRRTAFYGSVGDWTGSGDSSFAEAQWYVIDPLIRTNLDL